MFVHVGDSNSTTENLSYFFCKLATIKGRGDDVNYGLRWIEYCNKAVKIKMVVLMPMNMEQQVCVALLSQGPHTFITETSWDCSTTAFIAIHCNSSCSVHDPCYSYLDFCMDHLHFTVPATKKYSASMYYCISCLCSSHRREYFWGTDIKDDEMMRRNILLPARNRD